MGKRVFNLSFSLPSGQIVLVDGASTLPGASGVADCITLSGDGKLSNLNCRRTMESSQKKLRPKLWDAYHRLHLRKPKEEMKVVQMKCV